MASNRNAFVNYLKQKPVAGVKAPSPNVPDEDEDAPKKRKRAAKQTLLQRLEGPYS